MKPEPLRNKKSEQVGEHGCCHTIFHGRDIKSAVEWYKKYKDNKTDLLHDFPGIYALFCQERNSGMLRINYNDWLLNKAFEDVIDKGEKE